MQCSALVSQLKSSSGKAFLNLTDPWRDDDSFINGVGTWGIATGHGSPAALYLHTEHSSFYFAVFDDTTSRLGWEGNHPEWRRQWTSDLALPDSSPTTETTEAGSKPLGNPSSSNLSHEERE